MKARRGGFAERGVVLLAVAAAGLLLLVEAAAAVSEYQVKAAFLLNFGKFVEWPPESFAEDRNLQICVLGNDPFGEDLDATVAGRSVGRREVQPRRVESPDAARSCEIVFVSRSEKGRMDEIVAALRGRPVLLVGEVERFARRGGMINFVEVDQKIRFEINEEAAKQAGLRISSQLLKLATIVEGGR